VAKKTVQRHSYAEEKRKMFAVLQCYVTAFRLDNTAEVPHRRQNLYWGCIDSCTGARAQDSFQADTGDRWAENQLLR